MSAGDDTRTNGNGESYMKLGLHLTILVAGSLVFFAVTSGCSSDSDGGGSDAASAEVVAYELTQQFELTMTMSSTAFNDTRRIPRKYSCTQEDVSVPISWDGIPEGTVSLALLVESNQFPGPMWVHWLLWNIPPSVTELPEAIPNTSAVESLGPNASQGTNSDDKVGWSGPCKEGLGLTYMPRSREQQLGRARLTSDYFFRVYALDTDITLGSDATKEDFLRAIDGHILAGGELVGQHAGVTYYQADGD